MRIKNFKKINFYNTGIILISLCIIFLMAYLSRNCCFWGDDSFYAVYSKPFEGIFDSFTGQTRLEHGGHYIGLFLCKFFSFALPNLLSIHPADFTGIGHGFIKGILTVICLLITAKFAVFHTKSKLIYFLSFFFLAGYFFSNAIHSNIIIINYNFYRYFFSLIFFGIFWFYIYKNFVTGYKQEKIDSKLFGIMLCGFVTGTSIEIVFFSSALLVVLLLLYNFCRKYNAGKSFYFPAISLFLGILIFTSTPGFQSVSVQRGLSDIAVSLSDLNEFSQLYFQIYFKEEYIYWFLFISAFALSFYFAVKNKEMNKIIFPLFMQLSIIIVLFSLILCGRTYSDTGSDCFFLSHLNIIFLYKMLILYPLFMLLDYVIKCVADERKFNIKYLYISLSVCIFLAGLFYIFKLIVFIPHCNSNTFMNERKKIYYISEKIFRFYILKDEIPVLPDFYDEAGRCLYPYWRDITINGNIIYNSYVISYYPEVYKELKKDKRKRFKYTILCQKGYYYSEKAIEQFYNDGGVFHDYELENIKFYRLFDKDFVLNNK